MASLRECRARAKRLLGETVIVLPEKQRHGKTAKYKYRFSNTYAENTQDLSKLISLEARRKKASDMRRKLNGHRPKYGYKTVPRRRR